MASRMRAPSPHPLATNANVFTLQLHYHHFKKGDKTFIEQMQHNPIPAFACGSIQQVGRVAELARVGAQAEGKALELGSDGVDVQR